MRRSNLSRAVALLALAAMLLVAVGANALHPWLHAHRQTPFARPQYRSTGRVLDALAPHDECPVCAFLAGFHAPARSDTPRAAVRVACAPLRLPPASPLVEAIPFLPLGARAPPL